MAPKYDPSKPNFLRHFSLWLSFIHACCALVLVPIAIFGQAYQVGSTEVWDAAHAKEFSSLSWPQQLWRWCEALQQHEPTALHQFISGFAGVYYIVDLIIVWLDVHPIEFTLKCWYSVHHVLCWIGLVFPVFYYRSTWDIDLAYVGFWVGEISNPPRCIVDLLEYQIDTQKSASKDKPLPSRFVTILGKRYSVGQLQKTMATLAKIHLWSFVAFRFFGVHYQITVVNPYHHHALMAWMGATTLALSLMAMVVMLKAAFTAPTPVTQPIVTKKKEVQKAE